MNEGAFFTCEETFRHIKDYVDKELSADQVRRVEQHLRACVPCASEFSFEASLLRELRAKLRSVRAPRAVIERALKAISSSVGGCH